MKLFRRPLPAPPPPPEPGSDEWIEQLIAEVAHRQTWEDRRPALSRLTTQELRWMIKGRRLERAIEDMS